MVDFNKQPFYAWQDLVRIVEILRLPGGCPWDREQTHTSIRDNLLEECCEAIEAIDNRDMAALCEELGDVLLQVFLHARMAEEAQAFALREIVDGISKKLIERHPHVFGQVAAESTEEVLQNWDAIKRASKGHGSRADSMRAVSRGLPGFMRADKLLARAEKARPVSSESAVPMTEEQLGEQLLELAVRARVSGISPDRALHGACDRFIERFAAEEAAGKG